MRGACAPRPPLGPRGRRRDERTSLMFRRLLTSRPAAAALDRAATRAARPLIENLEGRQFMAAQPLGVPLVQAPAAALATVAPAAAVVTLVGTDVGAATPA